MILKFATTVFLVGFVLVNGSTLASYARAEQTTKDYKYYRVDAKVISLDASHSLQSYRSHGGGSGSPGSTLGYLTPVGEVSIALIIESNRFYADVTVHGRDEADAQQQRIELTNLRPTFLSLGTDEKGQTYHLNLTPSVVSVRLKSRSFQKAADDLYHLRFHSSRVVLNDNQYIGRMFASNAEVFSIEVCDIASIEFSLHHLKNAQPWGKLQDGQITLSHPDGTSIDISNVTNGEVDQIVAGGPYVVWVRWREPQQTAAQYRAAMSARREQVASGAVAVPPDTLANIDRELARTPGPWVTSSSVRSIKKSEIVGDE